MPHDVVAHVPARRRPTAWRRTIGALLRREREVQGLRLTDVAVRARLSPQYLSEVERGLKEPSSEVLAALTEALGLTLVDLAQGIVDALGVPAARDRGGRPVLALTSSPDGWGRSGAVAVPSVPTGGPVLRAA
ncbi:helix-turn-helix domain-containing protein [Cellulomonas shaoxiangyii]|uniref:Helix-turn-helix domain-containing protein n=1 Tax=Cellulomonas shaoxiangyii TaxID=2566013 RepID=A0A4P7SJY7_9CELL|nr:helix-turn-helix transcriptional regulator [Cellulomonas shaoxiangyii]QCB93436.1 helix-turn-helix domain-containing protein [Cellulomonas shaoxiangyii]TGY84553.1 helix-turn-helix domain-containing protein [Cellulomonas shaoxiangyii]